MIFKSLVEAEIGLEWGPVGGPNRVILLVDALISIRWRWIVVIVIDHKLIVESMHILPFLNLIMGSDFNVDS